MGETNENIVEKIDKESIRLFVGPRVDTFIVEFRYDGQNYEAAITRRIVPYGDDVNMTYSVDKVFLNNEPLDEAFLSDEIELAALNAYRILAEKLGSREFKVGNIEGESDDATD